MSLLLDALKKSGEEQRQNPGLSELTLEEVTPAPATHASAPASTARAAGETLFAAKKKPASFRWKLGLVPTTLLFAVVFASGYGYYVWLQIQPPARYVAQRATPLPPAQTVAPITHAAPAPLPFPIAPDEPVAAPPEQAPAIARSDEFEAPRAKPKAHQPRSRPARQGVAIQRETKADLNASLLGAYHAYERGDYFAAERSYHAVLARDARNRDALLGLAASAQQQGQDATAQYYYRKLLVLDPRDPVAQAALASYAPEDADDTESHLKILLAGQPRSGALHFALGNYYANHSDWADAQQHYFDAHTLEPGNAQFTFNLAVSLDHLGQRKLAAQFYQRALQLDTSGHSGFDRRQAQQRLNELTTAP